MPRAYEPLVRELKRIHALHEAAGHLRWDQETYMPPGGTPARAEELSVLDALAHERLTHPRFGELLAEAEGDAMSDEARALLRETRRVHDRATRVPADLVEALSRATSRAFPTWVEARKRSDFEHFRPLLEEIVDLRRRYAAAIDPDADPYAVLFSDYEPWLPLADARRLLKTLRDGLQPLIGPATDASKDAPNPFEGEWPAARQAELMGQILRGLGFDFEHGRIDVSAHPFSTGNQYDTRLTTRYDEEEPLSGLLGVIHEFGHSLYTLGLPKDHFGTPLGDHRGLTVHESQSRLWENHVGRSRPFMEWLLPRFREAFPERLRGATPEAAWRHANRIEPSLIRVEADELTYHLHVALRFEIEESLVKGDLAVKEVPGAWNEKMEKYLGLTPPNDAKGCLQDVHWSHGMIGYFPTYSLGSILAAQLFDAYTRERGPADDDEIRRGEFAPLRAWLRENVHQHGQRYKTGELVERATGKPLSEDAFLRYARAKVDALREAA